MTEGPGRSASSPGTRRGAQEGRNRRRAWRQARPEMKGNGSPTPIEGELARFLQQGCTTRLDGALRLHSESSGGLERRREISTGARVSGLRGI
jgi:hypothetical protein